MTKVALFISIVALLIVASFGAMFYSLSIEVAILKAEVEAQSRTIAASTVATDSLVAKIKTAKIWIFNPEE